ncbi:hypothetical protein PVL29_017680 [Vitis rotundifolia]|uniref:Uncharacterized protein n=1 Tax=Vitis rotundifolia TaxID=103349 RepID=A0AA39DIS8_VITRO|nr:hypothetical protein PVL29_017680 [Vitis rotundifolia]
MDMKKIACALLVAAASMSAVLASDDMYAPAPAPAHNAAASLRLAGSLYLQFGTVHDAAVHTDFRPSKGSTDSHVSRCRLTSFSALQERQRVVSGSDPTSDMSWSSEGGLGYK